MFNQFTLKIFKKWAYFFFASAALIVPAANASQFRCDLMKWASQTKLDQNENFWLEYGKLADPKGTVKESDLLALLSRYSGKTKEEIASQFERRSTPRETAPKATPATPVGNRVEFSKHIENDLKALNAATLEKYNELKKSFYDKRL